MPASGRAPVGVEVSGPEVGDEGDADAPGERASSVCADWCPGEEAAQCLGDRGEGLVSGELFEPGRQGGEDDEAAAEEGEEGEEHGCVAGGFDALGGEAEGGGKPDEREREQRK